MAAIAIRLAPVAFTAGVASLIEYGVQLGFREAPKAATQIALRTKVAGIAGLAVAGVATAAYALVRSREKKPLILDDVLIPESIVDGSSITPRTPPNCQVTLAVARDNSLHAIGCGIRTEFGLWVPDHVIAGHTELYIVTKAGYKRLSEDLVNSATRFGLEMLNIPVPPDMFSNLQVSVAKFGPLRIAGDHALAVGPDGKGSMGRLEPAEKFLGYLVYRGSTLAGFSGAPYMVNGRVVGIHIHGGPRGNGGQEALYLLSLFKIESRMKDESSEEWFEQYYRENHELDFTVVDGNVVARDETGHYHITTEDKILNYKKAKRAYQANPGDWAAEVDYQDALNDLPDDFEPESRFLERRPQVSRSLDGPKPSPPVKPNPLSIQLSQKQFSTLLGKLSTSNKPRNTNYRPKTQKASGAASAFKQSVQAVPEMATGSQQGTN